jgi:hypothetical protein
MRESEPSSSQLDSEALEKSCVICGYDLRADPLAICPECGTPLSQRERISQGRSAAATRTKQAAAWLFGIIVLVPWLIILALLTAVLLIDWLALKGFFENSQPPDNRS